MENFERIAEQYRSEIYTSDLRLSHGVITLADYFSVCRAIMEKEGVECWEMNEACALVMGEDSYFYPPIGKKFIAPERNWCRIWSTAVDELVPIDVLWPHLPVRSKKLILSNAGVPWGAVVELPWAELPEDSRRAIVSEMLSLRRDAV